MVTQPHQSTLILAPLQGTSFMIHKLYLNKVFVKEGEEDKNSRKFILKVCVKKQLNSYCAAPKLRIITNKVEKVYFIHY